MTGPFVYASSLAIDVEKMQRLPDADSIADETRIVLERIGAQLQRAGLTLRDVVKTTCYIRDESYRQEFLESYKAAFDPGPYPARATVILGLAADCRVQIEVVAATRGLT